ncbi:hypothetical protein M011DRAFT_508723, partial [Sporormia fimetaria CBS 119925]
RNASATNESQARRIRRANSREGSRSNHNGYYAALIVLLYLQGKWAVSGGCEGERLRGRLSSGQPWKKELDTSVHVMARLSMSVVAPLRRMDAFRSHHHSLSQQLSPTITSLVSCYGCQSALGGSPRP